MGNSNDPTPMANGSTKGGKGPPGEDFGQNTMFEALADERRRYLLYTLLEDESWSIHELATKVAAWEDNTTKDEVEEEDVDRVYASLYHAHVPKLVDLNIIEFDRGTETIMKGPNADQVLSVLEMTGASEAVSLEDHARRDYD